MWLHECYVSTNFVADFSSQRRGSAKWTRTSSQGRDRGGSYSLCTFSCWSEAKEVRRAPHTRVRVQEELFHPHVYPLNKLASHFSLLVSVKCVSCLSLAPKVRHEPIAGEEVPRISSPRVSPIMLATCSM